MDNKLILANSECYARSATALLADVKGFPLSKEQILGFLEIVHAYKKASQTIYDTDGRITDMESFIKCVHEDLHGFLDTDIPLGYGIVIDIIAEYTICKWCSVYVLKNNITQYDEVDEILKKFRKLADDKNWNEIYNLIGSDELWREI